MQYGRLDELGQPMTGGPTLTQTAIVLAVIFAATYLAGVGRLGDDAAAAILVASLNGVLLARRENGNGNGHAAPAGAPAGTLRTTAEARP